MKILGTVMVRNGEDLLQGCLDNLAMFCDTVAVIDDRSTDGTSEILRTHPVVGSRITLRADISDQEWYFPESALLELLLRLADLEAPDWVISIDHDQRVEPPDMVRRTLRDVGPQVAAVRVPQISAWQDPEHPDLVPIMGDATRFCSNVWRHRHGLRAGTKALHNLRLPADARASGDVLTGQWFALHHYGWDTLAKRIAKVDFYTGRDPSYELNSGVRYDEGLLFGYRRDAVSDLLAEYERRRERLPVAPSSPAAPTSA